LSSSLLIPVFGTVIVVGIVLSLVLGIDIVRFAMRQVIVDDEATGGHADKRRFGTRKRYVPMLVMFMEGH